MGARGVRRTIGVTGAIGALVGIVIGGGLFVLPAELGAIAGPAVLVSFAIAGILAVLFCLVTAQIGSVCPVNGASFVAVGHMLCPALGFLVSWMLLFALPLAAALLARTFAEYFAHFWATPDATVVALSVIVALGALNLLGARAAVRLQGAMVVLFMVALAALCAGGASRLHADVFVPFAPNGWRPVANAAVPAFFAFVGFAMLIEFAGEIRRPAFTIPVAVLASFFIVLGVYCLVTVTLLGIVSWEELRVTDAAMAEAGRRVLPPALEPLIPAGALAATATTINGIILAYSRELYALARARIAPSRFARLSAAHGEPIYGVVLMTLLACMAVLAGGGIVRYATLAVVALMWQQIGLAAAVLRLPRRLPAAFDACAFRIAAPWRQLVAGATLVISLGFVAISAIGDPPIAAALVLVLALGVAVYLARAAWLRRTGTDLRALVAGQLAGPAPPGASR